MSKKHNLSMLKCLSIVLPFVIVIVAAIVFLQNYIYNSTLLTAELSPDKLVDGAYNLGDINVTVGTRGGDTGSWVRNPVYDDDGNQLDVTGVGTIYEVNIENNTSNAIPEWTFKLVIPEDMEINNSWNGDFELHQYVQTNEMVQSIDLAEYSQYDITLDYYMDPVGPMIPLKKGDFFIYHPCAELQEQPIPSSDLSGEDRASVGFGFIVYIPNQGIDYVANFCTGEIEYRLEANLVSNPLLWAVIGMTVLWLICFCSLIIVRNNMQKYLDRQKRDSQIIEQTMNTFVNFIEAKDPSTRGHSLRVAQYSRAIAEDMDYPEYECRRIYYIALMHDCGKIYIPDGILNKPAKLTDEEYTIMKTHTTHGSEMLKDFSSIDGICDGAMYHHERYDGKGYPSGLSGENIPLIARIIGVCDAFDAMNSKRCYRSNLSKEVIIDELVKNKGKQFDPEIVDRIMKLFDDGKITF